MKQLILKSNFKTMSWKNGMGTTKEIAIYPPDSEFSKEDFYWRLSNAQVNADNSFSRFTGYDRHLLILAGNGIKLNSYTVKSFDVYSFQGEEPVFCSLLAGPVEDLGIIYDRNRCRCEMIVYSITNKQAMTFPDGIHFIKALTEGITVDRLLLNTNDVLKIDGVETVDIDSDNSSRQIVVISILMNSSNFNNIST